MIPQYSNKPLKVYVKRLDKTFKVETIYLEDNLKAVWGFFDFKAKTSDDYHGFDTRWGDRIFS